MRNTRCVRIFFVLIIQLLAIPLWAKSTFTGVPRDCEALLKRIGPASPKADVLKEEIDWSAVLDNMEAIGYPRNIARAKLREIEWDNQSALDNIRIALGKPTWRWGTPLTARDSKAIVHNAPYRFLNALPIWDSLNGFNTAEAVRAYMEHQTYIDEDDQKLLASYAPLWMTGRHATANILKFFELSKTEDGGAFALQISKNFEGRKRVERAVRRHILDQIGELRDAEDSAPGETADSFLAMVSALPYDNLPASFRRSAEKHWLALDKYRPLRLNSVSHIASGYEHAGDCEMMTNGHLNSLGLACASSENDEWKESVLVRVEGHIVGSLKLVGDPSMIALRNVKNSTGQLVLALGGVYHVSKDAYAEIEKRGRRGFRGWRVVDFDHLAVHPHSFMLNSNGWSSGNTSQIIGSAKDAFTKADLIELLTSRLEDRYGDFDDDFQAAMHRKVWDGILKGLNEFRRSRE
jgi:hypothetical protein